jgi:hypothetical protein
MTTSSAQQDFDTRLQEAVSQRDAAIQQLADATASVPRLKAEVAQKRADVAKLRADARAAGVRLARATKPSAVVNDAPYTRNGGHGPEDDEG